MPEDKTITVNRRARHEFAIDDSMEVGLVLTGTEIKSIRAGKVTLADAFARINRGAAWLVGAHVAPWEGGNREYHEPERDRKLLLHRDQIDELLGKTKAKGLALV
ncbi:MAG: SsrA-binding protein, partial [Chloroflexota bacterium]